MCLILSLGPYLICNEGDYRKFRLIELVSFQILKQSVGESRHVFFPILAVKRLKCLEGFIPYPSFFLLRSAQRMDLVGGGFGV